MLNRVEMLILDEADRMLDMGFVQDIRRIMSLLPANGKPCCSRPPCPGNQAPGG